MSRRTYWKEGGYKAICDSCGFEFKDSELQERYDGMMVCKEDWEPHHPSEKTIQIRSPRALPWTRPEGTDQFIVSGSFCTPDGFNGTTDHGSSGCFTIGRNTQQGQ